MLMADFDFNNYFTVDHSLVLLFSAMTASLEIVF